jgi:putative Mn2+ efflux pump MntP
VIGEAAEAGEWAALMLMASALGMDAFSLGIGIGMRGIRVSDMVKLSVLVALFHVMMPLAGMVAGQFFSSLLGNVAEIAGGGLLILLGLHMIYCAWNEDTEPAFDPKRWTGLVLLAFIVSIDSFSVGISMGLLATDLWLTVIMFGAFGGLMSVLGLAIGSRAALRLNGYGEALGGVILFVFGLKVLF